jgi:hypothetical protein
VGFLLRRGLQPAKRTRRVEAASTFAAVLGLALLVELAIIVHSVLMVFVWAIVAVIVCWLAVAHASRKKP